MRHHRIVRHAGGKSTTLDRLRLRLTVWYVGTFAAILTMFGALLFFAVSHSVGVKLDRSLARATDQLALAVIGNSEMARSARDASPALGYRRPHCLTSSIASIERSPHGSVRREQVSDCRSRAGSPMRSMPILLSHERRVTEHESNFRFQLRVDMSPGRSIRRIDAWEEDARWR